MIDKIVLRLNDRFALGADRLQWILLRSHKRGDKLAWNGVAFVSSSKAVLFRCMNEAGCFPDGPAALILESYPLTFQAWKTGLTIV